MQTAELKEGISMKIAFCLISMLLAVSLVSMVSAQSDIYVDAVNGDNATADGSAKKPYKTITFAFAKSSQLSVPEPWHVHVRPGTYDANPENPAIDREIFPLKLRDGMVLGGTTSAVECIIDAQHDTSANRIIEGIVVSNILIRNLTLENIRETSGAAIYLENKSESITGSVEGCVIQNNSKGLRVSGDFTGDVSRNTFSNNSKSGFYVSGTLEGSVSENTFSDNSINNSGGGFYIGDTLIGDVSQNILINNSAKSGSTLTDAFGGGFYVGGTLQGNVSRNTFNGNRGSDGGGGFCVNGTLDGNVSKNTFSSNGGSSGDGFYVKRNSSMKIDGILRGSVSENAFSDHFGSGFSVSGILEGSVSGNTFTDNDVGFSISESGYKGSGTLNGNVSENTFSNNSGSGFSVAMVLTGNVSKNTFSNNSGSGFSVGGKSSGTLTGDILQNTFVGNSASDGGGGFSVRTLTGNVSSNTFIGNSASDKGGGFNVSFQMRTGNISSNTFTGNSARIGGGLFMGSSRERVKVLNNLFLNNTASDNRGSAVFTSRRDTDCIFENNLFLNSGVEPNSAVWLYFEQCRFHNNIFSGMSVAIEEKDEFDIPITHNAFYNIKGDIIKRKDTGMGNALVLVELLLAEAHDNIDLEPKFVGESVASGTWTSAPTYNRDLNETTFTDANAAWTLDAFAGTLVDGFYILGNTATTMRLRGDVGALVGEDYVVDDYRLQPDSPLIDAGDDEHAASEDFAGNPRPVGEHVDIGPYEFGGKSASKPVNPWDVNDDGVVDISDLVLVGLQFGESGANLKGDVNGDGEVDVSDLVLVGLHFGESTVAAAPSLHIEQNMSLPVPNVE